MFSPSRLITQQQRNALRNRGFTSEQIEVLLTYRTSYRTGQFANDAPTDRNLEFGRWLYRHGKISG
jgi:hypothetical protein